MVSIRMAPRLLGDDPAESLILVRLTLPQCGPPWREDSSLIWRYPCGLAVSVTLSEARHPVKKALNAARDRHILHHRKGHKVDGDWAIAVRRMGKTYATECNHQGVMA